MAVDWGSLINAGIGAYGAYQGAQQANQPRNTQTNQTTTQTPFGVGLIAPDIEAALDYQRQLMAAGPRYVGQGGQGGQGAARPPAGAAAAGPTRRAGAPTTWTNARGETMTLNARGQAVRAGAGAGAPTSTAPGAPGAGGAAGAPHGIDAISDAVAQRGLAAGNDPATMAAQRGVGNILSGQGGASSGGSGYQGYNPINDYLANELRGDVEGRNASDLLRQFIGGVSSSPAGGTGVGSARGVSRNYAVAGPGGVVPSTASGGGNVPDTVGNSNSYFATQLRQLMDSPTNDADLQAIIDAQNADVNRGLTSSLWGLDAQAQGTGRFGGDMWAGLGNEARRNAAAEMGTNASRTRLSEQESRRAMYQNLLGQVNTRDLGAMQDATNRYGIDSAASSSSGASGAAADAANRAQQLQAIGMLLNSDQFNVSSLGDLGRGLSSDQLGAIGSAPSLAGVGLSGLSQANNAVGNLVGQQGNQTALRNAQIAAGTARAGMNQQAQMFNAQQPQAMNDSYFNMLRGIGGMGGTSTTTGTNVVPGMGVNPYAAALMGGAASYYGSRG